MISVRPIPVDLSPARLAGEAGSTEREAAGFLDRAGPLIEAAGLFDEVEPGKVFQGAVPGRGPTVIVGLCTLGPRAAEAAAAAGPDRANWEVLCRLALREALDFLEYRIDLFLKPTGRRPGPRLAPGCPDLPLSANRDVLDHFGPEQGRGFELLPSGEMSGRTGLVVVYPAPSREAAPDGRCARCARQDCPARNGGPGGKGTS
ncbi:MAG: hypothetical protein KKB20_19940 [Proteobacteria bacterium]|nr:hypothetical protein [Pseudomonadota bacterium]